MQGAVGGSRGWGHCQGAVLVLPMQLGAAALRFTVLLLALLSPYHCLSCWVNTLGQVPVLVHLASVTPDKDGNTGTEAMLQAGPWGLLPPPALCVCHDCKEAATLLGCAQGHRVQSTQGVWWVTPSQLPATTVVGLGTLGWVEGAPPNIPSVYACVCPGEPGRLVHCQQTQPYAFSC